MSNLTVDMENLTNAERKQLLKLVEKGQKKRNMFKPKGGEDYYHINFIGGVKRDTCCDDETDEQIIKIGNACADKAVMERKAKDMVLWSLLWNFAEENNDELDWCHSERKNYYIYSGNNHIWCVRYQSLWKNLGNIYFSSKELAQRAIDEIVIPYENGKL